MDIAVQEAISHFDSTQDIKSPDLKVIKVLLDYGSGIQVRNDNGATVLDWVGKMNFIEATQMMNNFEK